ncbi:MAG: hypothetical protein GC137_09365 [Alphaproteobacteria bacterium]|nr:hypothetical protein [Alphaproteobacteria bacterium]
MKKLENTYFLYAIIALEGYIILSSELLAIRLTIPFTGSGTDTISIIIAAVLMPLALGYYKGGRFKSYQFNNALISIRRKLLQNILIAAAILMPGLSYFVLIFFFFALSNLGIDNSIAKITLYCLIFLVYPMYLLGQTIPLVSNYFSKEKLSQITGKMLFVSTMGSFCGSVLTTLVLMDLIGVQNTVILIFVLCSVLTVLLSKWRHHSYVLFVLATLAASGILNSPGIMETLTIVRNNKYSTIMVRADEENVNHLYINNNDSSKYDPETGESHAYVMFLEKVAVDSIPPDHPPKDILVIGAGGFTFGHKDEKNNYVYLDIDKDLKEISEKYLLKEPLKPNKTFYPLPARAYLAATDKKFDIIFMDAYLGGLSIPEHLVTQEFFVDVDEHLKPGGVLGANFIVSPGFTNVFSKSIDNTLRSVFPYLSRVCIDNGCDFHAKSSTQLANFMYIYKKN